MTIFKLEQFPFVCRLCLQPESAGKMIPLNCKDEIFDGTISDFIASITFVISETKSHLFPQIICRDCLEMLKFFAKYRSKVMNVHLLMNCLVELKHSNTVPIEDLFRNKRGPLQILFRDLGLCNKSDAEAEDLINEFPSYEVASITVNTDVKVEPNYPIMEVETVGVDDSNSHPFGIFAEECTPEELGELTDQRIHKAKIKRKPKRTTQKKKDINWDFLNDDDSREAVILDAKNFENLESVLAIPRKYGGRKSDVPLRCTKCKYETLIYANFKSHQLTHLKRELKKYPCKEEGCPETFNSIHEHNRHRVSKHKPFVCEICGFQAASSKNLVQHNQRHLNLSLYTCKYCQKKFNVQNDLRLHIRQKHLAVYNFQCKTCGKEFKRKDVFKSHELSHGNVFGFPCKLCDSKFKNQPALNKHKNKVHAEASQICQHCSSAFYTRHALKDHIESVHGIRMRYICNICIGFFDSQDQLDIHNRRHTNPEELECGTCLDVFPSQEQFDDHLCITYRDDYFCCGRDQRHYQMYNSHMFMKHGMKTNVRVKLDPNVLLGEMRAKRKRVESCTKCEEIFPTRTLKKQHMENCMGKTVGIIT